MSYVTDVVIHLELGNDEEFTKPLRDKGLQQLPGFLAGGNKAFEGDVWAGAFNCFNVEEFVRFFDDLPWGRYDYGLLSMSHEGESRDVYIFEGGTLREVL